MLRLACAALAAAGLSGLAPAQDHPSEPPAGFAAAAEAALAHYPSAGIAVVRIEGGTIAWTGYAGEQAPGIPAGPDTLFNVASIAKTVTAETVLRLAEDGLLDLDAPIPAEAVHADLAADPRAAGLTPAILLSHQSGLKNWPHNYEDGRLAFIQDPGTGFTYSGAGYEMLARTVEAVTAAPFAEVVRRRVLVPAGVAEDIHFGAAAAPADRQVVPMGSDGQWSEREDWEEGVNAADDLFVTAPGYAVLMLDMLTGSEAGNDRDDPRTVLAVSNADEMGCGLAPEACPEEAGHTLGWSYLRFGDRTVIYHGGADWAENAIALYEPASGEGWVFLVNGGNGLGSWIELGQTLDPENPVFALIASLPQVQRALDAMRAGQ